MSIIRLRLCLVYAKYIHKYKITDLRKMNWLTKRNYGADSQWGTVSKSQASIIYGQTMFGRNCEISLFNLFVCLFICLFVFFFSHLTRPIITQITLTFYLNDIQDLFISNIVIFLLLIFNVIFAAIV